MYLKNEVTCFWDGVLLLQPLHTTSIAQHEHTHISQAHSTDKINGLFPSTTREHVHTNLATIKPIRLLSGL